MQSITSQIHAGGNGQSHDGLTDDERRRYERHFALPDVGEGGQERLKESSVLLVGAGGLGAPLALYLAAAGVGRIGLVDFDRVEASNLQRQVLYSTDDAGRLKLDAAEERLHALNPHVSVERHDVQLSSDNALEIIGEYDVVADGSDNFPTRYLVNDACTLTQTPNIHGSVYQFEGQVSVFCTESGPSYRCMYPEPPAPGSVPSCAEGGILGVLPGLVGTIQAAETLKMLLGIGDPLVGRLLMVDALGMQFRTLKIDRNPDWPPGAPHPTVTELIDYEDFCSMPFRSRSGRSNQSGQSDRSSVPSISPDELREQLGGSREPFILDVRTPKEYEQDNIGGTLIPLNELSGRLDEIADHRDDDVVVYCRSGARSARAVQWLRSQGFERVRNLEGGLKALRRSENRR